MTFKNKTIKLFLLVVFMIVGATPTDAVFKENDFGRTIDVLCAELEAKYKEQKEMMRLYENKAQEQHKKLVATMQQIDQISLILYSQSSEFSFDMAYACQQATDLYHNNITSTPFNIILKKIDADIERYDSLIYVLKHIAPAIDDSKTAKQKKAKAEETPAIEQIADSIMEKQKATHKNNENTNEQQKSIEQILQQPPKEEDEKASLYVLNDREKKIRELCLTYAQALRNNLIKSKETISKDKAFYDEVKAKLASLNRYALKKYEELQNSIFKNGGSNYFTVLSTLGTTLPKIKKELKSKYNILRRDGEKGEIVSQWRGPVIIMSSALILICIFIATILSVIILRWFLPRRIRTMESYLKRRAVIGLACGVFLFTIFITIAYWLINHNFILMAIGITIIYSWLLLVILVSLLIRLNDNQIKAGAWVYTPFMLMAFVVIVLRIIFIPNMVVSIVFPPLALLFTIWQLIILRKKKPELPTIDVFFAFFSLAAMVFSTVFAWCGYTLLAVQIMMWWSFQLACIQTIVCLYDLAKMYEKKYLIKRIKKNALAKRVNRKKKMTEEKRNAKLLEQSKKGDFINSTWLFDFFLKVALPVMAVISVLMSVVFAARMFNMKQLLVKIFYHNFIDQDGIIQISLYKIFLVLSLSFLFYYINYLAHSIYRKLKLKQSAKNDPSNRPNITLANNIITILVWGSFIIFALVLFKVPKGGISLISAGLATGLGFAMKDILENFIYGLSLMSGRVKVGDFIECDGILGKVESIGYQSTQMTTLDGSVIAFLNTQLFNKNFKNMTKNHSYEYVKLPIGVAYGVDVEQVREMLTRELNKFLDLTTASGRPVVQKKQEFKVYFSDFGDNSINLLVAFWVLVEEKISFVYKVKETIYNTLQRNNIEIPFPQHDVYIRRLPQPTTTAGERNKKR
ncbi:MAG: mechanosensitive ion channel [Muribaculaceae bacterium]|nr:mechanosensitive ion channel [Muribaculaceae bacterium]